MAGRIGNPSYEKHLAGTAESGSFKHRKERTMPGHDIIVMGASAGGVETLAQLVRGLPKNLPAAVFIVLHVPAYGTSILPQILNRHGPVHAVHPADGDAIQHGRIYVAPPDHHLLIKRGYIHLARGPRENGHRPAADPLFRTAARAYGPRVVGVVLSGALDDGTAGLAAVKMRGGVALVQDPEDAYCAGMPRNALENVEVDYCLPLSEIPPLLVRLAHDPALEDEGAEPVSDNLDKEADIAEFDLAALENGARPGTPSGFACPDCGGSLWELRDGELIRFRCRVGHAWSGESLLAHQAESLETALWTALRALEENAALGRRLASQARHRGLERAADSFERQGQDAEQHAALIRQLLLNLTIPSREDPAPNESGESEKKTEK
jgi:two-component system chemotaxis response regulator CheB